MAFQISCNWCGTVNSVEESMAGRDHKCGGPFCGMPFKAPTEVAPQFDTQAPHVPTALLTTQPPAVAQTTATPVAQTGWVKAILFSNRWDIRLARTACLLGASTIAKYYLETLALLFAGLVSAAVWDLFVGSGD